MSTANFSEPLLIKMLNLIISLRKRNGMCYFPVVLRPVNTFLPHILWDWCSAKHLLGLFYLIFSAWIRNPEISRKYLLTTVISVHTSAFQSGRRNERMSSGKSISADKLSNTLLPQREHSVGTSPIFWVLFLLRIYHVPDTKILGRQKRQYLSLGYVRGIMGKGVILTYQKRWGLSIHKVLLED